MSHTPLRWAQKMSLLGSVSVDKKSFMQAIFPITDTSDLPFPLGQ